MDIHVLAVCNAPSCKSRFTPMVDTDTQLINGFAAISVECPGCKAQVVLLVNPVDTVGGA